MAPPLGIAPSSHRLTGGAMRGTFFGFYQVAPQAAFTTASRMRTAPDFAYRK